MLKPPFMIIYRGFSHIFPMIFLSLEVRGHATAPWSPRRAPISKALGRSGQRRTPPAEEILARGGAKGWGRWAQSTSTNDMSYIYIIYLFDLFILFIYLCY
jgi:hypothetical protein